MFPKKNFFKRKKHNIIIRRPQSGIRTIQSIEKQILNPTRNKNQELVKARLRKIYQSKAAIPPNEFLWNMPFNLC